MGNILVAVLITLGVIVVIIVRGRRREQFLKKGEHYADTQATTEEPDFMGGFKDDDSPYQDVFIAGLVHHCTRADIGPFSGFVYNEKGNSYSSAAMAVWDTRKQKILGYIPEAVLDDYNRWCRRKKCPCVGVLFWDGEYLRGRLRAYIPGTDQSADAERYLDDVCEHFGWKR